MAPWNRAAASNLLRLKKKAERKFNLQEAVDSLSKMPNEAISVNQE
jgi:hypothetical protein